MLHFLFTYGAVEFFCPDTTTSKDGNSKGERSGQNIQYFICTSGAALHLSRAVARITDIIERFTDLMN
jgi:hypothetical protein